MMKYSRLFVIAIVAAIAAMAASTIGLAVDCTRAVVVEEDISRQAENTPPLKNWVLYFRNAGNGAFRTGPATPPSGVGSFELTTPTSADKATLFNYDHIGTKLSEIDKISYATYRTAGQAQQVAALNIQVDINGAAPGGFTTLVFEPVYNTNQGVVQDGIWQTWDAFSGGQAIWWSSNPIPSAPNRDTFVSWATIVAANPDAVIVGGFGVNQGSGNPGLISAVDVLTLGSNGDCITYDFEPFKVATTKDDCKNGGYNTMKDAQGNSFKNQGQCIQYVNTGK
ncbi:MAG TPA: hypothetical protein VF735_20795 [Pyrinomonadaceae bacterium]|jgi:hypothetical protein